MANAVVPRLRSCTVYLGSRHGTNEAFATAAEQLARALVARGMRIIYGGGTVGLMGVLARTALASGGEVTGIIPKFLAGDKESDLTSLDIVDTMAERKASLFNKGECIIVMPGGVGTLEEAFEVLGWITQAPPERRKAIGFLSICGYYDPLLEMLKGAVDAGFMQEGALGGVFMNDEPEKLIDNLLDHAQRINLEKPEEVEAPPAPPGEEAEQNARDRPRGCVLFGDASFLGRGEHHSSVASDFGVCVAKQGKAVVCSGSHCGGLIGATLRGASAAGGKLVRVVDKEPDDIGSNMVFETIRCEPGCEAWQLIQAGEWFVGLSGGVHVWGQIFEVFSLVQLGRIPATPLGLLSVKGYYSPLMRQLRACVHNGFLQEEFLSYIVSSGTPEGLIAELKNYAPKAVVKTRDERPAPAPEQP